MAAPSEVVAPLVEEAGAAPAEVGAEAEVRAAQEAQQAALPAALWLSWVQVREPVSAQEPDSV